MRSLWRNSDSGYGLASVGIHWVSVLLVFFLLATGLYMVRLTYYDTLYHTLPQWHKVAGILLAIVTLPRLLLLLLQPSPTLLPTPLWQQRMAHAVHHTMRVLLAIMLVTGYFVTTAEGQSITFWGGITVPALTRLAPDTSDLLGVIHRWSAYTLAGCVAAHAGAALYHHFFLRDKTLRRMLWPHNS